MQELSEERQAAAEQITQTTFALERFLCELEITYPIAITSFGVLMNNWLKDGAVSADYLRKMFEITLDQSDE